MTDQFNLGQLTKEMVVSRLKEVEDAPAAAAEIVTKTIISAVKSTRAAGQSPRDTVAEITWGAISGLILIEKDLPRGAALLLKGLAEVSASLDLEAADLMTWSLEGMARIAPVATPEIRARLREAIETEFMGVGEVFDGLCEQAKNQAPPPQ